MKSGDARVALIGFPSVGKVYQMIFSSLLFLNTCYTMYFPIQQSTSES